MVSSTPLFIAPLFPDPLRSLPAAINHLLMREGWARDALRVHAGKSLLLTAAPFRIHLAVTGEGLTELAGAGSEPAVRIEIPLSLLPQMLGQGPRAVLARIKLEGDASFAQVVSELVQKVRWEAEEDLSRWVGDIAARRITTVARGVWVDAQQTQRKIAENLAEYWLEEDPELVRPRHVEAFANAVRTLRDDLARLEKRIDGLEQG